MPRNSLDASAVHPERSTGGRHGIELRHEGRARRAPCVPHIQPAKYVSRHGRPAHAEGHHELGAPGTRSAPEVRGVRLFQEGVGRIEDLKPGMKLPGIVTNVAAFGAFVDMVCTPGTTST